MNPSTTIYEEYGALIAALVRHVAKAFKVPENDVWECVDNERDDPTTPVTEFRLN